MLPAPRELLKLAELRLNPPELPKALLRSIPDDMLRLETRSGPLERVDGLVLAFERGLLERLFEARSEGRFVEARSDGRLFEARSEGRLFEARSVRLEG